MSTAISEQKTALRQAIRVQMKALSPADLRPEDDALFAQFLALPQTAQAKTILLYHGMGAEPETARLLSALLAAGKQVALPRCLPGHGMEARLVTARTQLVRHKYGMLEPGEDCPVIPPEELDLILVPGLAFDRQCRRLGQGGGFYDRYLAGYTGPTVALCRPRFLLEEIPCDPHDRRVDCICTPQEIISAHEGE